MSVKVRNGHAEIHSKKPSLSAHAIPAHTIHFGTLRRHRINQAVNGPTTHRTA